MSTPGKALTLHQPWASLVAVGAKMIETRSWRTSYRGWVAIHAGMHRPSTVWHHNVNDDLPPAIDLVVMSRYWDWAEHPDDFMSGGSYRWIGPLGAVVAVTRLTDCAPIGGPMDFRTGTWEGDEGDFPDDPVVVLHEPLWEGDHRSLILDRPGGPTEDISEQLPYGDFTPGRWAWLLSDVRPLPEPIPAKGRQGLWTPDEDLVSAIREQTGEPSCTG